MSEEIDTKLAQTLKTVQASMAKLATENPLFATKINRVATAAGKAHDGVLNPKEAESTDVTMYEKDGRIFVIGPQLYRGANYHHKNRLKEVDGHSYDGQEYCPDRNASKEEKKAAFANPLTRLRSFSVSARDALVVALGISYPSARVVDEGGKPTGETLPNTPFVAA